MAKVLPLAVVAMLAPAGGRAAAQERAWCLNETASDAAAAPLIAASIRSPSAKRRDPADRVIAFQIRRLLGGLQVTAGSPVAASVPAVPGVAGDVAMARVLAFLLAVVAALGGSSGSGPQGRPGV